MADEIVISYSADIKKLQTELHKAEKSQLDLAKGAVSTGNTISKQSDKAAKGVQNITKSTQGLSNAFNTLSSNLPFAGAIQQVQGFGQALTQTTGSIGKVNSAMQGLKIAFASLGIGAIVIAFGSLIAYFKNTEAGGDRLAKIMRVVGAVFGDVLKVVTGIGEALFDAGEAVVNYVGSADKAVRVTDDYKKSTMELAAEIADLEDQISALSITVDINNAVLQTGIEKNLRALRNRNITLNQSLKLIDENGKKEKEQLTNSNSLLDKKLAVERKQFILAVKSNDLLNESDLNALKEKLANSNTLFGVKEMYYQSEIDAHNAALAQLKEQTALFDKFVSHQIDTETLLNNVRGLYTEEDAKRVAGIIIAKQDAIRNEGNALEKLQNNKDAAYAKEQARLEALKKANNNLSEEQKIRLDEEKKIREDAIRERVKSELRWAALQKEAGVKELDVTTKTEIGKTEATKEEKAKRHKVRVDEMQKYKTDVLDPMSMAYKEDQERQTQKLEEEEEKRRQIRKQVLMESIDMAGTLANGIADIRHAKDTQEIEEERVTNETKANNEIQDLQRRNEEGIISDAQFAAKKAQIDEKLRKKEAQLKKRQFEADQKAALIKIAIDTAVSVAKTAATAGYPAAIPLIVLALAQGAIQAALVKSQPVPKFKDGVIDLQGKGTGTSDSISAKLSKGESVMTAKETKQHKPLFKAIREGSYDDYINRNHILPHVKKLEKEQREAMAKREGFAKSLMESIALNSVDTSHLERLTKKNKSVRIENASEIVDGLKQAMKPKSRGL
jgi:hypothetical protein